MIANVAPRFSFQWMNMADMTTANNFGHLNSSLDLTFNTIDDMDAGEYLITVAAFFKNEPTKVAAFQTMKFTLTGGDCG